MTVAPDCPTALAKFHINSRHSKSTSSQTFCINRVSSPHGHVQQVGGHVNNIIMPTEVFKSSYESTEKYRAIRGAKHTRCLNDDGPR